MRRILTILGVFVLIIVAATAIALYLVLRLPSAPGADPRGDATPRQEEPSSSESPAAVLGRSIASFLGVDAEAAGVTADIVQEVLRDGQADMGAEELAAVTTTALSGSRNGRVFLAAAEPLAARIRDDRVHMGSILDLGKLDTDGMDPSVGEPLEKLLLRLPFLSGRRIYVEMSTLPVASEGDLDLGTHAAFQLGSLPLPPFLTRLAGLDEDRLERFTVDLRLVDVQEVTVRNERLILRARPRMPGAGR